MFNYFDKTLLVILAVGSSVCIALLATVIGVFVVLFARSKLIGTENIIPKALIDIESNHESLQ